MSEMTSESGYVRRYKSTEAEVSQLRKMATEWVRLDHFWNFDQLLETLHRRHGILYYLAEEEKWIAAVLFVMAPKTADLCYLFVRPEFRGKGFGLKLLESSMKALCTETDAAEVMLEVKLTNTHAIHIYEQLGFERISERKSYYNDGSDALVMKWHKQV
jgi:ribosomal-protein-alanine N-acetyltransferase